MSSKNLVIIGANEFQKPLVEKAAEMDFTTHVFAWDEGAVCKEHADYFYSVSITELDTILDQVNTIKPQGVISIGSDLAIKTVNYIANQLGLIANSIDSTEISTDKYKMRKVLHACGLPCPKFILAEEEFQTTVANMLYPLIVKPVDRSGSRGVSLVHEPVLLNTAIERAKAQSFNEQAIIEEFISGQEYSMEMITFKGKHHFLAITEKFTTGAPNFIEKMHLQPGRIDEKRLHEAIRIMKKALDALGVEYGATHSEFKVDENGVVNIIEIGARMGGDYIGSQMVPLSTGYDYLRMVIDIAVGNEPQLEPKAHAKNAVLVRFIFSRDDLKLFDSIQRSSPAEIYSYGEMRDIIGTITQSSERFGYFILWCDDRSTCLHLVGEEYEHGKN